MVSQALSVREMLANKEITMLEHPPYSPDLAPSKFFLTLMTSGVIRRQL
jgi:transposase